MSCDLVLISCDLVLMPCDLVLMSCDLVLMSCDLVLMSCDLVLMSCDLVLMSCDSLICGNLYNDTLFSLLTDLPHPTQSISSRIKLELSEGASEDIRIKFESKCNGTEWMETHLCEGVVIDQEVGKTNTLFGIPAVVVANVFV